MTTDLTLFEPWPKIPRLRRDVTITEKIDGTNAAVVIRPVDEWRDVLENRETGVLLEGGEAYAVSAQSRKRFITPQDDNYGFARWVTENAVELAAALGEGRHFGEWWGQGIQRGYGLDHRRFSLFNSHRWADADLPEGVGVVPVLYVGVFSDGAVGECLAMLDNLGSKASVDAAGVEFDRPEGVCVFMHASGDYFKVLLENDELPKGVTTARERQVVAR